MGCILTYGGSMQDVYINYFLLGCNLLLCTQLTLLRRKQHAVAQSLLPSQPARSSTVTTTADSVPLRPLPNMACRWFSLAFVAAFQIQLCLWVECSGVSIIWCAMAGWAFLEERWIRQEPQRQPLIVVEERQQLQQDSSLRQTNYPPGDNTTAATITTAAAASDPACPHVWGLGTIVQAFNLGGVLYYALTEEWITTVAHGLAILLGCCLWYASERTATVWWWCWKKTGGRTSDTIGTEESATGGDERPDRPLIPDRE